MRQRLSTWSIVTVGLMMLVAGICWSQGTSATVAGEISDNSGSMVAGAKIEITNINTGIVSSAVTNDHGQYRLSGLVPGVYRAGISKEGFKTLTKDGIELHVEDQVGLNFSLEVGAVTESVTIEAGTPLVDTQSTSLGDTIEGRQVQEAPLNGRNAMNLIGLVPGVVPQGTTGGSASSNQASKSVNSAGFGNYQIGGGLAGWNATYIDGANVNSSYENSQSLIPTQDSVGEFHVDTSAVSAEYGRFAGGVVSFSTKSGTNQFHGTAYEYLRNTVFDANTFFNDRLDAPVPVLHQNQFGAALGGPIVRNKSFFFFSWESTRLLTAAAQQYRVPTPAEMNGDFTADYGTATDGILDYANLVNGVAQKPEACPGGSINKICPQHLSFAAAQMYKIGYFQPVETDPAKLAVLQSQGYNSDFIGKQPNNAKQFVLRVDHQLNANQKLFARATYWTVNIPLASELPSPQIPQEPQNLTTQQYVLGDNYTISPTLNADIRVAYTRFLFGVGTNGNGKYDLAQFGPAWATIAGEIPYQAPPELFPNNSWANQPTAINLEQHNNNDDYSVSVNFTKVVGHHSIQFGGEARRIETYIISNIFPTGDFSFSPGGIAEFAVGVAYNSGGQNIVTAQTPSSYNYYQGYYATDTFQLKPNLTLNVGLRWELPGAWLERHNDNSVLLANTPNPLGSFVNPVAGGSNTLKGELVAVNSPDYPHATQTQEHLHLFEPRLGINYSFIPNTVIRAGFGLSHPCLSCSSATALPSSSPLNSATTLNQPGFSSLDNPYPNGINLPLGRSLQIMEPHSTFPQTLIGGSVNGQEPYQKYPYVAQWNLDLQRSFGSSTTTSLSYSGSRGVHLGTQDINLDQLPDQYDSLGSQLLTQVANPLYGIASPTGRVGAVTANYGQFLLPYPEFSTFTSSGDAYGESIYHAMSALVKKSFRGGATINASYTWAHFITNVDSPNGFLETGQSSTGFGPQDYTNHHADRSDSAADVRQRLVLNYILDLPFGKGKRFLGTASGVLDRVVSGWGLSGITQFQSGLPLGFTTNSGNELSANFGAGTIRPNLVPGVSKNISGSRYNRVSEWFNTAAFAQPGSYAFGNEGRLDSSLRADGIDNWDMDLVKNTAIKDGVSLQFRAEYFNVFNHTQFAPPNTALGNANFGIVTAIANNPRIGQMSVRVNF